MRSCMKIEALQNGKITLLFTDIGKSCPSREFLKSQMCILTLFAEKKILEKISKFTVVTGNKSTEK